MRKHKAQRHQTCRDIKLVATEKRKNYFVSELYYHTTKFFSVNLLAIETKKKKKKERKKEHRYS